MADSLIIRCLRQGIWTIRLTIGDLVPSVTTWRYSSGLCLVQVMAYRLTAPSHYHSQW